MFELQPQQHLQTKQVMMSSNKKYSVAVVLCFFAALSCYLQAASSHSLSDESLSIKHEKWMAEHERYYESKEEKAKRFKIFKANVKHIESFNAAGNRTYKLGVNKFTDLTNEEFLNKYGRGFKPHFKKPSNESSSFKYANVKDVADVDLDWRKRNAVTPVQNQGSCGCCWAFSAVAAMEGIIAIRSGKLVPLSEQHLLDCNYGHEGCRGGKMEHAFDFVQKNGGLASDNDYPYTAMQGECTNNKPSSLSTRITGFGFVPSNNEGALLQAVANQPVSVAIDPKLFQFYHSGVLTGDCGVSITHAVTAVGYGIENGIKYWLFKNSWGPNWGDGGYIKLERDIADRVGMCGIAIYPSFPNA